MRLLAALLLVIAAPLMHAQELRLLHADAGRVRSTPLPREGTRESQAMHLRIEADGRVHALRLATNSSLATLRARAAGRAEAYVGKVEGYPHSWAAVTRIGAQWSGIWYDGAEYYGVEPAAALAGWHDDLPTDAEADAVVYRLGDVVWGDQTLDGDVLEAPAGNGQRAPTGWSLPVMLAAGEGPTRRLEVAFVMDAELLAQDDGNADANLLARVNVINALFSSQLGVEVTTDSVSQFTGNGPTPFSDTDDADVLLGELSSWRTTDARQRDAALTHLFTGRNLEGRTVGLAYLDTLCSRRYSASLSEARSPAGFAALIAAHEIAHVFGAPHDGDPARACAATPQQYLMASRINGSQQFSPCSVEQMAPQVEGASCLVKIAAPGVAPTPPAQPAGGAGDEGGGGGGGIDALALMLLTLLLATLLLRARSVRGTGCCRSHERKTPLIQTRANQSSR